MAKQLTITDHLGLKLAALYDEPAGKGPFPLVILLHGNTGWKEDEHLATLAADLASAGIAALRFDAPGSGGSEGTWAEHYRVSNYLADVMDVYNFAIKQLNVDPARVSIWGHSLGGMVAIYVAAQYPKLFKAVCGSEPSSGDMSMKEAVGEVNSPLEHGASLETETFGVVHLPAAYFRDRQPYYTAEAAKKLHLPLLLIAGTKDDLVLAASVRAIYEAAHQPKQYLEFPTDHYYKRNPKVLADINAVTVKFFHDALC